MDKHQLFCFKDSKGNFIPCQFDIEHQGRRCHPNDINRLCDDCREYIAMTPQDLATLESQLTTANEAVAAQGEALRQAMTCLHGCENCAANWGCKPQDRPCLIAAAWEAAKSALSQTPAAARQLAEDGRVGRAVEEWFNSPAATQPLIHPHDVVYYGPAEAKSRAEMRHSQFLLDLASLREAIAQAKAGDKP